MKIDNSHWGVLNAIIVVCLTKCVLQPVGLSRSIPPHIPLEDKKHSMLMKYIPGAIRLKMLESLEGLDVKRFKQNRVSI